MKKTTMKAMDGQAMDRRNFLKGAFTVGAAVAAGSALAGCASESSGSGASDAPKDERTWDQETEVLVVGLGFAGMAASMTAADAGSKVTLIEKAPEAKAGGNSRVCAQAVWTPRAVEESVAYFKEITGERHLVNISDAIIETYIQEASNNYEWLHDTLGMDVALVPGAAEYPLAETAEAAKGDAFFTFHTNGLGSAYIWNDMYEIYKGKTIDTQFETAFSDLIFNGDGEVIGVEALVGGETISIAATKAVVLCCGGFEYNEELKANYLQYPCLAWGSPYNTGDAIKACMKYDIDFWHMNSATPATRIGMSVPSLGEEFANTSLDIEFTQGAGYFWVDKYGKRFMNESSAYQHGYGRNAIFYNDGMKMEWPRLPFWQVFNFDELKPTNRSGWLEVLEQIHLDPDLAKEIADGVVVTAETPQELARKMGADEATFMATLDTFNAAAASGTDELGRPAELLKPVTGPYYAAQVYPVMVNTNGGPKRNENSEILRVDGTPVPRLYSAGELGSVWAWYYQGAGNVSESMAFGRIAGQNASALTGWKESE